MKRKGFDRIPSLKEGAPARTGEGAPGRTGEGAPGRTGEGAPVRREGALGGGQRIPGLGSDTDDCSPGTSSKPVSR